MKKISSVIIILSIFASFLGTMADGASQTVNPRLGKQLRPVKLIHPYRPHWKHAAR